MRYIFLMLIAVSLCGCFEENPRAVMNRDAYERCVKNGGVPILSAWSSSLEDCRFPPKDN